MKILKSADHRRMPWKNGLGMTTEIAVFPSDADLSAFGWRVSMASVLADGPFSSFPGVDRTLSILEGEGMALAIDGAAPVCLDRMSDPLFFAADVAVEARLSGGRIEDLNVMTRRDLFSHGVCRQTIIDAMTVDAPDDGVMLIMATDSASAATAAISMELAALDCLMLYPGDAPVTLRAPVPLRTKGATVYRIDITPVR